MTERHLSAVPGPGGVYDDEDAPPPPLDGPDGEMPLCPVCPAGRPYSVRVARGGGPPGLLECGNCGTLFRGTPNEMQHPRNVERRRIQAEYLRAEQRTEAARKATTALIERAQAVAERGGRPEGR